MVLNLHPGTLLTYVYEEGSVCPAMSAGSVADTSAPGDLLSALRLGGLPHEETDSLCKDSAPSQVSLLSTGVLESLHRSEVCAIGSVRTDTKEESCSSLARTESKD